MPLPKKLKKDAPKSKKSEVVKDTMHDLKHGPRHKDRTHKQEVAIAMKQSGQAKSPRERQAEKANKKVRNKGRGN
jgi:hypothetical protein